MIAARTTGGSRPERTAYPHTTSAVVRTAHGLFRPAIDDAAPSVSAITTPTCRPEIANRCDMPAVRNDSLTGRGSSDRIPSSNACANPDSGAGTARCMADANAVRTRCNAALGREPPPVETNSACRAHITPTIPCDSSHAA